MSGRKSRERAAKGLLFRDGRLVSPEEAENMKPPHIIRHRIPTMAERQAMVDEALKVMKAREVEVPERADGSLITLPRGRDGVIILKKKPKEEV